MLFREIRRMANIKEERVSILIKRFTSDVSEAYDGWDSPRWRGGPRAFGQQDPSSSGLRPPISQAANHEPAVIPSFFNVSQISELRFPL